MGAAACRTLRVGCRARQGERARRRPQGAEDDSIAWTVAPCPPPLRSMLSPHAALAERLTQGADASRAPLLIPTAHAICHRTHRPWPRGTYSRFNALWSRARCGLSSATCHARQSRLLCEHTALPHSKLCICLAAYLMGKGRV
jgi:hypothetical protein